MHILTYTGSLVLPYRKVEKPVAPTVHSPFIRVATVGFSNLSVATSDSGWIKQAVIKWVKTESRRIQHSTAAQHSNWIAKDVNRQVATEHVQNKCSLRWSIVLLYSHAAL